MTLFLRRYIRRACLVMQRGLEKCRRPSALTVKPRFPLQRRVVHKIDPNPLGQVSQRALAVAHHAIPPPAPSLAPLQSTTWFRSTPGRRTGALSKQAAVLPAKEAALRIWTIPLRDKDASPCCSGEFPPLPVCAASVAAQPPSPSFSLYDCVVLFLQWC